MVSEEWGGRTEELRDERIATESFGGNMKGQDIRFKTQK
jgi:hypothetical protein